MPQTCTYQLVQTQKCLYVNAGASPARGRTGTRTRSGRSQFPSGQDAEAEGTEILAPIPIKGLSAAATHVTRKDDTPPAKDQAGGMLTPVTQPSSPATSPSPARRRSPRRPKTPKSLLKSAATPSRGMRVSWRDIARHEEMARTNFTVVPRCVAAWPVECVHFPKGLHMHQLGLLKYGIYGMN